MNSQEWIDSVVIGVNSKAELISNLKSISMPFFNSSVLADLEHSRPNVKKDSLDPANWTKNQEK